MMMNLINMSVWNDNDNYDDFDDDNDDDDDDDDGGDDDDDDALGRTFPRTW